MSTTAPYRWNARQAAESYDAAGPVIHPYYDQVQQAVVEALPFAASQRARIVDLGGGSGRLAERLLAAFPSAMVTVVDPSAPFLELARRRLARFGDRAGFTSAGLRRAIGGPWRALSTPL